MMLVSTFFNWRGGGGEVVEKGTTPITQGLYCFLMNSSVRLIYKSNHKGTSFYAEGIFLGFYSKPFLRHSETFLGSGHFGSRRIEASVLPTECYLIYLTLV